jgi:hypothetical protein
MAKLARDMLTLLALALGVCPAAFAQQPEITFLAWSDQHVTRDGNASHLHGAIDAMNAMAGTKYPSEIGGQVTAPEFVLGCGDCTDWPTRSAKRAFVNAVTQRLKWPTYNLIGNHDEGDIDAPWTTTVAVPLTIGVLSGALLAWLASRLSIRIVTRRVRITLATLAGLACAALVSDAAAPHESCMRDWIVERHGGLSYSFRAGGVHLLCIFSRWNPRQRITAEALAYIRNDLRTVSRGTPVVVATHYCLDAIQNRDDLVEAFGDANVVLVLGGHHHAGSHITEYRGLHFAKIPSPTSGTRFTVVRIADGRISALAYDYGQKAWVQDRASRLDVPLTHPSDQPAVP